MKEGIYLSKRLSDMGITDADIQCNGFNTFESYYYAILKDEYYNLSNDQKTKLRQSPFDNILFTYSTIWGQRVFYKSKTAKWTKTVERVRYNENNRFDIWNPHTHKQECSPKYRTAKGGKISPFFNGIFAYFVKPLEEQGCCKEQIIQQLQPIFRKIVITEGEFKTFVGCLHQIPTIGISGIHNAVNTIKKMVTTKDYKEYEFTSDAHFLIELQEFLTLFQVQEITFLMDQDAFDNEDHELRSKSFYAAVRNFYYASRNANIQMHFAYIRSTAAGKGLDDILQTGNRAIIRQELLTNLSSPGTYIHKLPIVTYEQLEQLHFSFAQSVQQTPYFFSQQHQVVQAKEGAKLSQVIQVEDTYNKILVAPTGSGKTYLISSCPDWKILVCPTISLCKNVASEYNAYQFEGKEIVAFEQMMTNFEALDSIYQLFKSCYAAVSDTPITNHANFIVVTYKSFRKLTAYLNKHTHRFRLFIDESHNFTTSTSQGYLLRELDNVLQLSTAYQSTTLLTGTYLPVFHATIAKLPLFEVRIPKPPKTADLLACTDVLKAAANLATESIENGRFPMILFNSKNDAGKLGTLKSYLKEQSFAFFNASTKTDEDWLEITENGNISSKYKGICVTSILKEGNNIYNSYTFDIIIIGTFHSVEIEQFCNRSRLAKSIHIYKLISNKSHQSDSQKSIYSIATNFLYKAISTCEQLNKNEEDLGLDLLEKEFTARQFIAALPIVLDQHQQAKIDELRLSNMAFQIDRLQENRNDELLRKRLTRYNILLNKEEKYEVFKSKSEMQASRETRLAAKNKQEAAFTELHKELQNKEIFSEASRQLTQHSSQLSSVDKGVYQRIQSVSNLVTDKDHVLMMLEESRLSNAKFTLLRRQYVIQCLRLDTTYMQSNRTFAKVLQQLYSTFSVEDKLTVAELRQKLLKVLSKDASIDTSRITKDATNKKTITVLKLFFDLERKQSNGIRFYTLQGTKWTDILINTKNLVPSKFLVTQNGYPDFWENIA